MKIWLDLVANDPPRGDRAPAARLLARLAAIFLLAFIALPAAAQTVSGSALAGVSFPRPATIWLEDAAGSHAAALALAASLAGRTCGATEFDLWQVGTQTPEAVRAGIDSALASGGWLLSPITTPGGGAGASIASRSGTELLMSWSLPAEGGIGLAMCTVTGGGIATTVTASPLAIPGAAGAPVVPGLAPLPRPKPAPLAIEPAPGEGNGILAIAPQPEPAVPPEGVPEVQPQITAPLDTIVEPDRRPTSIDDILDPNARSAAASPAAAATTPAAKGKGGGIWGAFLLIVIALACGAGAFFLLRRSIGELGGLRGAASWPATIATVVYSDVASQAARDRRGREATRYVPVVAYEYVVNGETYRAARLRFGDASQADPTDAARVADHYPVGAGIEIRYDTRDPHNATIEAGPDRLSPSLLGGVLLAVIALAALIGALA